MNKNQELVRLTKSEAVIIFTAENLYYFTQYENSEAVLIMTKDKSYYFTDNRYTEEAEKTVINAEVREVGRYGKGDAIREILKGYDFVGFENNISYNDFYQFLKPLDKQFIDVSNDILMLRAVKTDEEIKKIRTATEISEKSLKEVTAYFKEGISEKELANELEYRMVKNGADCTGFKTIVAFGKSASVPHHTVSDKKLKSGDVILIDFGAKYKGYTSDITRTFLYGRVDEEIKNVYNMVLKANALGLEALCEGKKSGDVDKAARDYLTSCGYGDKFTHSLGHGVGVEVHEYPTLRKESPDILKNNMVVTVEPGIYIVDSFGIRIEDICRVNGNKADVISSYDKKFNVI